ncbi:hypothetical protein SDC9_192493 [bioreactor metagenome]|uniref:Uncharacterized protein n=1 Tax=bioreactor metagenome TaxID=1076179 RepID=A0A645I249_9ZZZZ
MVADKQKSFKFIIIMSIICSVLTGINYIAFKVPIMGIAFIITTIGSIFNFVAYKIDLKKSRNDKL